MNKYQVGFYVTDRERRSLDAYAKRQGLTRSAAVGGLVRDGLARDASRRKAAEQGVCLCGIDAQQLGPGEAIVHRTDGPCYIAVAGPTTEGASE